MISVDSRLFAAPPALPVVRSQPTPPRCAESQGASRCESPVRFRATLARLTQREEKQSTFGRGMRRNCLSNAMRKKKTETKQKTCCLVTSQIHPFQTVVGASSGRVLGTLRRSIKAMKTQLFSLCVEMPPCPKSAVLCGERRGYERGSMRSR